MIRSLWIAKTGMEAQQMQLDTISHNLANVSTNGFKRGHVVFEDLIYQNLRQAGAASSDQTTLPTGLQVGLGVRSVATSRNFTPGQPAADRQQPRPGDQGQRVLPDPDARRHDGLHPRRFAPGRRCRASWSPTTATPCSPASPSRQCAERHDRRRRHRQRRTAGPGRRRSRSASCIWPRSSTRPASSPRVRTCAPRPPPRARPNAGAPGSNGLGLLQQGYVETSNVNVVEELVAMIADPARLRDEFQGDPDLRPDAAEAGAVVNMSHPPVRLRQLAGRTVAGPAGRAVRRSRSTACRRSASARRRRWLPTRCQRPSLPTAPSTRRRLTGRCSRTTAHAWSVTR